MKALARCFVCILIAVVLSGCAAQSLVYHSADAQSVPVEPTVLLLPPDVVISRLNAGGNTQPEADWSQAVSQALMASLREHFWSSGVEFVEYGESLADRDIGMIRQLNTQLDAIELRLLKEKLGMASLGGDRDYFVGESETEHLQNHNKAYLLMVVLKANRATSGRVVTAVLASFSGAAIETNSLQFRSALIDLRDGHVKWANFDDQALAEVGDVLNADEKKWARAVEHLLRDLPL